MASIKKNFSARQSFITSDYKSEPRVLNMSNEEIKKKICATHTHSDRDNIDIDVTSLFAVVKNILNPAIVAVEKIMGNKQANVGEPQAMGESGPEASFNPPLCILKELSNEMACKNPGEETAQKTTMSILKKLEDYRWDAKAVLTLAAFALDYGEFWHLAESLSLNQLTKSLGILKRVPIVLTRPGIEKYKDAIVELNTLIRNTLKVIECILNLEELLANNDFKDVPTLSTATDSISVEVSWAIISVVDCMAWMCSLIKDEDKSQEISPFASKITSILKSLKEQIKLGNEIIDDRKAFLKLKRLLESPRNIVEVFNKLFFPEDSTYSRKPTNNLQQQNINILFSDKVEEVKEKEVLLFFSDLDISEEDVSILNPIYEEISRNDQYKIVWIPIVHVEQWVDEMQNKFETLVRDCKMKWYVVPHFSSTLGIKYIEEEWQFKKRPIIVVLNSQGIVKHHDAFPMIKTWGIAAFPFSVEKEGELQNRDDWFVSSIRTITNIFDGNDIQTWINHGKYIFFFGGTDGQWITQFREKAQKMKDDSVITSDARISIELIGVGQNDKGKDDLDIFWNKINDLFFQTKLDTQKKEIQNLLSYTNDKKGWVVLCKGSRLVFSGYGTTVVKVLEKFNEWKLELQTSTTTEFEVILKEKYKEIVKTDFPCCAFQIKTNAGWVIESLKCPDTDCPKIMEMYVSFNCCHEGHTAKAPT